MTVYNHEWNLIVDLIAGGTGTGSASTAIRAVEKKTALRKGCQAMELLEIEVDVL